MNNRQHLSVLSLQQQNILKKYPGKQSAKGLDLQKGLRKIKRFLLKDMLTLPNHRYTGIQSTPLED